MDKDTSFDQASLIIMLQSRDKKIAELEATRDEQGKELARVKLDYQDLKAKLARVEELEARLQRIKELPQYICEFPDIGKLGGAYRKRDVDEIIQAELEKKS